MKVRGQLKSQTAKKATTASSSKQNGANVSSPHVSTNMTSRKTKKEGPVPKCCGCNANITDDMKALQCDKCHTEKWKCIGCLNMSSDFYDQLLSEDSNSLRWFCDSCDRVVMEMGTAVEYSGNDKIDKLVVLVEKLVEKVMDVEGRLANKCDITTVHQIDMRIRNIEEQLHKSETSVEKRLAEANSNISKIVTEQLRVLESSPKWSDGDTVIAKTVKEEVVKKMEEDGELEKRKNNLILYRIPEDPSNDFETRKASDKSFVFDLLDSVFKLRASDEDIIKFFRLGRLSEGSQTPRPLLLGFKDIEMKEKIMQNLKCLKQADAHFRNVSVAHDLTPSQREEVKKMIEAAKQSHIDNDEEDVNNFRFLVVGQGAKRKVIKIRKQS